MNKKYNIAFLLTCHNRRDKTLTCLKSLYNCSLPDEYNINVFLVDDGSTDGTSFAVRKEFPLVNIINGNGQLFWNQGMRLAWETAAKECDFDFYFWLNDDTILFEDAIIELLKCYNKVIEKWKMEAIIAGACQESFKNVKFSYGGRNDSNIIIPNGQLQSCKYINGNAVLIPKIIFDTIGNLSAEYTHTLGDYDYGLRARLNAFECSTTTKYVGVCPRNEEIPAWCNPKINFKKRWKLFNSPSGLNIHEYIIFRKKFEGNGWIIYALKAYLKFIFPRFYNNIKHNNFSILRKSETHSI